MHRNELKDYGKDFCGDLTKQQIAEKLYELGVSIDYSTPASLAKLKNLNEDKLRLCYNSIIWEHNLVDVSRATGSGLEITNTDKYDYMLTYSFPCITNDSLILTNRGYIELKDVTTNDMVLTKSRTWQKVAKKFDNGMHQTCYLDAMGFENIHCTLNHKFYVRQMYRKYDSEKKMQVRKFKQPVFKEVKDLTRKDYLGVPIIKEEKEFYTNDLDFWFMIGMYLGDGWLSKNNNDIIFACNDKKLKLLKDKLNKEKYRWTYRQETTCYRFRFSNKEIYNFILKYIGTGCENKKIPYEMLCLPKKQLEALYNGYLESDGCKINNIRQFSSINKNLIYSISLIINKLFNMPTRIYKAKIKPTKKIDGRIVNQKDLYQLRFKTTFNKQDKAFYEDGYIWYPFNKIIMANEEHVYNMEIENDHSYIVQGCISKNCQDLSLRGKGAGMEKGSGTRSGLLWEVERLLSECNPRPQILIMENVPAVHSAGKNDKLFKQWQLRLEELGYQNYWEDVSATECGIPQTRTRCLMVSLLGGWNYKFPKKTKLKLRLKDLLEKNVDKSFYLSNKQIENVSLDKEYEEGNNKIAKRLGGLWDKDEERHQAGSIYDTSGSSPTLDCSNGGGHRQPYVVENPEYLLVKNATKKGYLKAFEGDGVDISSRMDTHRGTVQNGKAQTLKTRCEVGVVVPKEDLFENNEPRICASRGRIVEGASQKWTQQLEIGPKGVSNALTSVQKDNLVIEPTEVNVVGNYSPSGYNASRIVDPEGSSPTVMENHGTVTAVVEKKQELLIRKLTPNECFRLMGVKDSDARLISEGQSNGSCYHLAGDSIVVNCLMRLMGQIVGINWKEKFEPEKWWNIGEKNEKN